MKIVLSSHDGFRRMAFDLHIWWHLFAPAVLITLLLALMSMSEALGLPKLSNSPPQTVLNYAQVARVMGVLDKQLAAVDEIKQTCNTYSADADTLSLRLGEVEAEVARLNALAQRVADKAKLDPKEFALDAPPARGGYGDEFDSKESSKAHVSSKELFAALDKVDGQAIKQKNALEGLYKLLEGLALNEEVLPSEQPTYAGYISSPYGFRHDPFNGRSKFHEGVDFAGPLGTPVYAIAAGVVAFNGKKGGYGNVLEIDHGDGLVSRYAHLSEPLVNVGDIVKKGDHVALMGSTGRSTGPHLHLEILHNGERLDPLTYLHEGAK